jgi:type IV pilus assembly protein PilW
MLSGSVQTMKSKTHLSFATKQKGVSLVELMVGLVIGLVLALAASAAYLYSKQGFNTTSETSQAEENGRFALNLLTRYIQSSGFIMLDKTSSFPFGASSNKVGGCDYGYADISALDFTCLSSPITGTFATSAIKLVFETDAPKTNGGNFEGANCIGEKANGVVIGGVTKTYQVTSYFFVSNSVAQTEYGTTTLGQLSCRPGDLGAGATSAGQPLIPGIVQIDFKYIVGAAATNPRTLKTAAQVTAASEWDQVSAVDLCVMSKTLLVGVNDVGRTYVDCKDNTITADPNAIYRTFRTRVNLRNVPLS